MRVRNFGRSYFTSAAVGSHWTWLAVDGEPKAMAWESLAEGTWQHVRLTASAPFADDLNLFSRVTDNDPRCALSLPFTWFWVATPPPRKQAQGRSNTGS